jgi:alpha-L-arabinofuranosidase
MTLKTTISVTGAAPGPEAAVHTVTGDTLEAANSFRTPDAVRVRTAPLRGGGRFALDLPPHSVSVLVLPLAAR